MKHLTSRLGRTRATVFLATLSLVALTSPSMGEAQTTSITSSGLGTTVKPPVAGTTSIVGGTAAGTNLFHSFGNFSIGAGELARFETNNGIANSSTSNIISRVTGTNPSSLFGTLDTKSYFPSANFFLVNPNGIVFGPNASINVGGSANFVAGDYLRMTDNAQFFANPAQTSTLSVNPVSSFGFLSGNPLGTIQVQGGTILNKSALTLVGRDKTNGTTTTPGIEVTGTLNNFGGKVALVSVGTPAPGGAGEVSVTDFTTTGFSTLGTIAMRPNSSINTSTTSSFNNPMASGDIVIRGDRLEMDAASLKATSRGYNRNSQLGPVDPSVDVAGGNIDIVAQAVVLKDSTLIAGSSGVDGFRGLSGGFGGRCIGCGSTGILTGGNIRLNTQEVLATDTNFITRANLDGGTPGSVKINGYGAAQEASRVELLGTTNSFLNTINTGASGLETAPGGTIEIFAKNVALTNFTTFGSVDDVPGGDFVVKSSQNITILDSTIGQTGAFGKGGSLRFEAGRNIKITNSDLRATSTFSVSGNISLSGPTIALTESRINTDAFGLRAGNIAIRTENLTIQADSEISSKTSPGQGAPGISPGTITIEGMGASELASTVTLDRSTISTSTVQGGATSTPGNISIKAQAIVLSNGGAIEATTTGSTFNNITAVGGGPAGNISLVTQQLSLSPDSAISSSAKAGGTGLAGSITITGPGSSPTTITGGTIQAQSETSASAGTITLTAPGDLSLVGTTVSVKNTGTGNAGGINLTSGNNLLVRNSLVSTESAQASGGDIKLTAPNIIRIVDSTLSSSVQGQAGSNGGNINIDPQLVVIQNSNLLANANAGAGGNITVIASGAVLVDPNSQLNASAGPAGVSGSVNINTPVQVLGGALVPLKIAYTQAGLSGDRCAADPKGQFSSFVQTGRDGVPQVPGALSPSPLSFLDTLASGSLELGTKNLAAAQLGFDSPSLDDSALFRFHSACRS